MHSARLGDNGCLFVALSFQCACVDAPHGLAVEGAARLAQLGERLTWSIAALQAG